MQHEFLAEVREFMAEVTSLLTEISAKLDSVDGICTLDEIANNVEAVAKNLADFKTEAVSELNSIESTLGIIEINTNS